MSSNADGAMSQSAETRKYPERPILAVGGVVVHEGRVLLIRRGQPPMEGRWSIPGGIVELGEVIADAVARELKEETGVCVRVLDLIEIYEKVARDEAGAAQYHFVILDYQCEFVEGAAIAGGDVTEIAWATEQQMESLGLTAAAKRVIQKAFSGARGRAAHQA